MYKYIYIYIFIVSIKVISNKETLACKCADDNPSSLKLCLTTPSVNLSAECLCTGVLVLFQRNSGKKRLFLNWDVFPLIKKRLDSVVSIMVALHADALKEKTCR